MATRRLFYAIEFPELVRNQVHEAAGKLRTAARQGRWTHPDNLHLTLQFLGDCPDEWLPDLFAILRRCAAESPVFTLRIAGCGTFGRQGDILWLGVQADPALDPLVAALTCLLCQNNLPFESRPYSPHITIGRQVRIDPVVLRAWTCPSIEWNVSQISLMESTRIDGRLAYLPVRREMLHE